MIWLNGALREHGSIDPSDRGFTLGDGLFETMMVRDGRVAFLPRHLQRLRASAAWLDIPFAWTEAAIAAAIAALARPGLGRARLTLSRGPAEPGLLPRAPASPTAMLMVTPFTPPTAPATAITCAATRRNEHSPLSRHKTLNYLDAILARREADMAGCDEAILLNTVGDVAEATAANLIVALNGRLFTPPIAGGALPGITRALLIERAGVVEARLTPTQLRSATAVVLCNSLGLRALAALDGQPFQSAGLAERLTALLATE